jgi:hypothetical protein
MLHAFVREANDSIAELFKMLRCSILIPLNLLQVNGAVQFDNQATGRTAEICDELSQWMLPSEFIAVQLMTAQACPQQGFSGGWIAPKFFGTLIDLGGSAANAGSTFDVWAHDECRESKRQVKYVGKYSENEEGGQTRCADVEGNNFSEFKRIAGLHFRRNILHVLPQLTIFIAHAGVEVFRQFERQFQARDQLLHIDQVFQTI